MTWGDDAEISYIDLSSSHGEPCATCNARLDWFMRFKEKAEAYYGK